MKTGKKIFIGIIAVFTLLLCFTLGVSALDASGSCGENVTYTYNSETGEVVISGEGDMTDYYCDDAPWYDYCESIKSIEIVNGITSIGDYAFYDCNNLTSITIPDGVTTIGDSAFDGCRRLTSITIPDSVVTIGDNAFYICNNLTSITIPDSVTSIGECAFGNCWSLASVTIGDSVTSISDYVFASCKNLTSIRIPDSVTYVDNYAFYGCTSLISITIPEGVISIGNHAFDYCTSLTSITIPNSVTNINEGAFNYCTSLESIKVSDNITIINNYAFYGCTSLTRIIIPEGVTCIGDHAFYSCYNLTTITIPDSVTSIDYRAFADCGRLESITIPDSVTSIGDGAFCYCESLSDVYYSGTKIQWNNVSVGGSNEPLLEATWHFSENVATNLTDSASGITAEYDGAFEQTPELVIKVGGPNANFALNGQFEKYTSYDISFEINGKKVQPNGMVTIKIPIPSDYSEDDCEIYYIDESGNQNKLNSTCANGYITFVTEHFSEYVIVDESSKITVTPSPEPVEPDEPDEPSNDCSCNCHKTGFMSFIWKILRFFYKLFKINPVCDCGTTHY